LVQQVEGPKGKGVVNMHLIKRVGKPDYEYKCFFVDVRGHERIYLENADAALKRDHEHKEFKLFGVKWT
jgi:mitochondrial import inner membrane translocase subunit TIM21